MVTLTPDQMRAAYALLRLLPPFSGWDLPPAEEVSFVVHGVRRRRRSHEKKLLGLCTRKPGSGRFTVYVAPHRTLAGAVSTLAHEMIHVHEWVNHLPERTRKGQYIHGPAFQAAADAVCQTLKFPRATF